jgi:phosphotransferase system enzyme I (PtsI)
MASDPRFTPILLGLGVQELSMSPLSLGPIRRIIRRLRMYEAEETARRTLECDTSEEALEISEALLYKVAPDIVDMILKGV